MTTNQPADEPLLEAAQTDTEPTNSSVQQQTSWPSELQSLLIRLHKRLDAASFHHVQEEKQLGRQNEWL